MHFGRTLNSLLLSSLRYNLTNRIQFYSVYSPDHVKPIFKHEEQESLYEKIKSKEFIYPPVKAATSIDTCSAFHDSLIRQFTNYLMKNGKRKLARQLVEQTLENIKILQLKTYYDSSPENQKYIILDPKILFHHAIENCSPVLEVQRVIRGGITYQVPVPVNANRARFLSVKWFIETAQEKGDTEKFPDVLAKEIINAAKYEGRVIKKKHNLHKQCEANRAFAHYRWI